MPTVTLAKATFLNKLKFSHDDDNSLENVCFQYGLEYEEDNINSMKIEVPANRIDLLLVEGISRALNIFNDVLETPKFCLVSGSIPNVNIMRVDSETSTIRPYCFACILRNISFTPDIFQSFIDFQEKLHNTIGRKRQLVAIGTHDLDKVEGPFYYKAVKPDIINFIPLNGTKHVNGYELLESLKNHPQLKNYIPLIENCSLFPVIYDSKGEVLSVPPIINSNRSKITLESRNILIEVTAWDATKGSQVLNAVATAFSEYCAIPYSIESIVVEYSIEHTIMKGAQFINPSFPNRQFKISPKYIEKITGIIDLEPSKICHLLKRMMIIAHISKDKPNDIIAYSSPLRQDILHPCDLAEDVAIAYGYNNIPHIEFPCANELVLSTLLDTVREEFISCGYQETLTWGLSSIEDGFINLCINKPSSPSDLSKIEYNLSSYPVTIANPKTKEFQIVRTSLIPGILKTLAAHKALEMPLKLFEIGNTVRFDNETETRALTFHNCCALIANTTGSGLENLHGVLDILLLKLNLLPEYYTFLNYTFHKRNLEEYSKHSNCIYKLIPNNHTNTFIQGRCADIVLQLNGMRIGMIGVIHPRVLKAFNITLPCSIMELSLNFLLNSDKEENN